MFCIKRMKKVAVMFRFRKKNLSGKDEWFIRDLGK